MWIGNLAGAQALIHKRPLRSHSLARARRDAAEGVTIRAVGPGKRPPWCPCAGAHLPLWIGNLAGAGHSSDRGPLGSATLTRAGCDAARG